MSTRRCLGCSEYYPKKDAACPHCNTPAVQRHAPPPAIPEAPPARVPWSERRAAFERARPALLAGMDPTSWTRDKWIAHWNRILNDPEPIPIAHTMARAALDALGATARTTSREPGQDDEESAYGDSCAPARLPLGIAEDPLERDFGGIRPRA